MHGVSAVSNDPNAVRKMYADIVGLEQAMKRVDVSPGMLSWAACGCFKGQWSFDDVYIIYVYHVWQRRCQWQENQKAQALLDQAQL